VPKRRLTFTLCFVAACQGEPGELDRDVVHDLSRTRGEARGTERTGRYFVRILHDSCPCSDLDAAPIMVPSICAPHLASGQGSDVDVVESDGFLLVRVPGIGALTGPIEPDGGFSVGAVVDLRSPVSNGAAVLRGDGTFHDAGFAPGELYTTWRLTGILRRRVVAEYDDETTDCTEQVSIEDATAP
jgi:hypothetical protein